MADSTFKADKDWLDARLGGVGLSAKDASRKIGLGHPNKFWASVRGERRLQIEEALSLAKLLKVSHTELLARWGYDVAPSSTCQLIGTVNGRGRVSFLPPDRTAEIIAPTEADADLKALRIDAEHTRLALYHGTTIYYLPSNSVRADAFGRLAVLDAKDQPTPILGILDRGSYGQGLIRVYGGIEDIETDTLVSASPVLWQRSA